MNGDDLTEKQLPKPAGIEHRLVKVRSRREAGKLAQPTRSDAMQMQGRLLATQRRIASHLNATKDKGEREVLEELLKGVQEKLDALAPLLKK